MSRVALLRHLGQRDRFGEPIRSSWAIAPSSSSDGSACWASAQVMSDSVAQTSTCCTCPSSDCGETSCA